jgi:dTDP-4-amino-4,6-dideoxygalactose transaminase
MSKREIIQIAWAPNVQKDDVLLALSLLFRPWTWFGKTAVNKLTKQVSEFVGAEVSPFDSGRSALYKILQTLSIGKGDEVMLQAFTCVALPNPILWVGAKPVWVDLDLKNLNISIEDFESKITERTKAVVVQYTFGITPDIERIKRNLCKTQDFINRRLLPQLWAGD